MASPLLPLAVPTSQSGACGATGQAAWGKRAISGLELHLRGGGLTQGDDDSDDVSDSDQGHFMATQAALEPEPEPPQLVRLVDTLRTGEPIVLPVTTDCEFTIGRDPRHDLVLTDPSITQGGFCVHGDHASIYLNSAGMYMLKLIGKTQCTFINEIPLNHIDLPSIKHTQQDVALADGDTLRFGGYRDQGYSKFIYQIDIPDAIQPDRKALPLTSAPAPPAARKRQRPAPEEVTAATSGGFPAAASSQKVAAGGSASAPASAPAPSPELVPAPAASNAQAALIRVGGNERLPILTETGSRTLIGGAAMAGGVGHVVGFIKMTRDGLFNMHVTADSPIVSCQLPGSAWTPVLKGRQLPLRHGALIELGSASLRYECHLPTREEAKALAKAEAEASARYRAPTSAGAGGAGAGTSDAAREAAAAELAATSRRARA